MGLEIGDQYPEVYRVMRPNPVDMSDADVMQLSKEDAKDLLRQWGDYYDIEDTGSQLSGQLIEFAHLIMRTISTRDVFGRPGGILEDTLSDYVDLVGGLEGINLESNVEKFNDQTWKTENLTYDEATRTIKVKGLGLGKGQYIKLIYKVKAKDLGESFEYNKFYPTNGDTTILPRAGRQPELFPVPMVKIKEPVKLNPAISLVKEANLEEASVGDKLAYKFTIKNEGDVALEGFTIKDKLISEDPIEIEGTLEPGETLDHTEEYEV